MALKVKISKIGFKDIGKFGTLAQARDKVIDAAPAKEVSGIFPINKNAAALHPDLQKMKIAEVIEHEGAGAKTFILRTDKAAYFERYADILGVVNKLKSRVCLGEVNISCAAFVFLIVFAGEN